MNKVKAFFENLSELIFPSNFKCIFCGKELDTKVSTCTCENCVKKLPFLTGHKCRKCGDKIDSMAEYCIICKDTKRHFDVAYSPFIYKNQISASIIKFKFENAKYLFKPLSTYLAKCYYENNIVADIVVGVPMTEEKQKQRGYNQANELAKNLAKFVNLPYDELTLKKIKNTDRQVDLEFEQRSKNVCDAFWVTDRKTFKGKDVLLVDDVLTTGATCDECAKALKKGGAKKVIVLTLARTHIEKKN